MVKRGNRELSVKLDIRQILEDQELQKDLEAEMRDLGIVRYRNKILEAKEKGQESTTSPGLTLLKKVIPQFAQGVEDYFSAKNKHGKKLNKRGVAYRKLKHFPSKVLAYVTFKTVLDSMSTVEPVQTTALRVGSLLEDEVRFKSYSQQNPALLKTIKDDLKKRTQNYRHQRTVIIHSANKANLEWKHWTKIEKVRIGIKCLEILIKSTGLFEYQHFKRGVQRTYKRSLCIQPKGELLDWIDKRNLIMEALSPIFLPMLVSPVPWTTPYDGGYTDVFFNKLSLVKTHNADYLRKLEDHKMPEVYKALNNLQRTEWKINKDVYDVMKHHWDNRSNIPVMPELNDMVIPPKPEDFDTNEESKKEWKRRVAKLYQQNIRNRSKKLSWTKLLWMAEKFKEVERLYFPYNLDFRGRAYCVSSYLTPQGPDEAKGLLTFAEEQELTEEGTYWLLIHGANCWGKDKDSLDGRYHWTKENEEMAIYQAEHPLENTWWMGADKPWQFLAFCFALKEVRETGCCSIPVTVDGSCNGLQHFSAMLRDEIGGEVTNLIPKDKPADIYQVVADKCEEKNDYQTIPPGFISRSLAKRPVMTTPYGATLFGIREQIMEELQKQEEKGTKFPFTDEKWKATCYLSSLVWDSIGETVVAAREAMSWLQEVARVATTAGKSIYWETPVGFPVYQDYKKLKTKRIPLGVGNSYRLVNFNEESDELDMRKQVNGLSPNLIHSYDSAHMMKVVNRCEFEGIESLSMVHDSFGTHANNMSKLNAIIRAEFVDMYEKYFPLQGIYDTMKLDGLDVSPPPKIRNLDLNEIQDSLYFFS